MPIKKKKQSIEYRLLVTKLFDETRKKEGISFSLETTKQFTNFNYQIDVEEYVDGNSIRWKTHGLRAPLMSMPSSGSAFFEKIYFDMSGTIDFTFKKKDGENILVKFKILKSGIKADVTSAASLKIYTDQQEFEKQRANDTEAPKQKPNIHRKLITLKK